MKRTERRARTQALDLGLAICCAWFRDLAAVASSADDVVLNADRRAELAEDAQGLDPAKAREAVEWVLDTRRRLQSTSPRSSPSRRYGSASPLRSPGDRRRRRPIAHMNVSKR